MPLFHLLMNSRPSLLCFLLAVCLLMPLTGCTFVSPAELHRQQDALENAKQRLLKDMAQLRKQQASLKEQQTQLQQRHTALSQEEDRLAKLAQLVEGRSKTLPQDASGTQEQSSVLIGETEPVYLEPSGLILDARIDTGATTSSLNAVDLQPFERDGKAFVRFHLRHAGSGELIAVERPVLSYVKIKRHNQTPQRRPVVKLRAVIGSIDQHVKFTLTDRSNYQYQVLIGRNFLRDFAVVDVSEKHLTTPQLQTAP